MGTPGSDDSLLPKPAPYMPASPHGQDYVLCSERADWDKRATGVAAAATLLDLAIFDLNEVADRNAFGDCVEGIAFYKALVGAIDQLNSSLDNLSRQATTLAQQCRHAGETIADADADGAAVLEA